MCTSMVKIASFHPPQLRYLHPPMPRLLSFLPLVVLTCLINISSSQKHGIVEVFINFACFLIGVFSSEWNENEDGDDNDSENHNNSWNCGHVGLYTNDSVILNHYCW